MVGSTSVAQWRSRYPEARSTGSQGGDAMTSEKQRQAAERSKAQRAWRRMSSRARALSRKAGASQAWIHRTGRVLSHRSEAEGTVRDVSHARRRKEGRDPAGRGQTPHGLLGRSDMADQQDARARRGRYARPRHQRRARRLGGPRVEAPARCEDRLRATPRPNVPEKSKPAPRNGVRNRETSRRLRRPAGRPDRRSDPSPALPAPVA
jgi:hypothetical protein